MPPGIGIIVGTRGRGSNMAALVTACTTGALMAQVKVVIGSDPAAGAMEKAKELGVPTATVPFGDGYGARLLSMLADCEVVCLAGFMRLLPSEVLSAFPGRVLNIHPSLLPKFGGKGMYGHHVHDSVLAAGEVESGCTVHEVNEVYDDGRIVLQMRCPVLPSDTPESLAARVLELEHRAYPAAVAEVLRAG